MNSGDAMAIGIGAGKNKLVQINSAAVHGEPGTGYMGPEDGPFRCGACEYFKSGSCGNPEMKKLSKREKTSEGRVKVSEDGCCIYFEEK